MLKFSSVIPCTELAQSVSEFLVENSLVCWSVEKDILANKYFLCGYVETNEIGKKELAEITKNFPDVQCPAVAKIGDTDWAAAYRKSAKPWQCENLYWIPMWMKGDVRLPEDAVAVYIEPGMAFGTGTHETTQLCARALVMFRDLYAKTDDLVVKDCIDVGCGSGILGISAIRLGVSRATFIDIDEDAVRISRENAQLNGLFDDQVDFVSGDLKVALLGRQTDLLMANILSNVLIKNADLLVASVKPGGLLCLSGILTEEKNEVGSVFSNIISARWESFIENSFDDGEWSVLSYFRG